MPRLQGFDLLKGNALVLVAEVHLKRDLWFQLDVVRDATAVVTGRGAEP